MILVPNFSFDKKSDIKIEAMLMGWSETGCEVIVIKVLVAIIVISWWDYMHYDDSDEYIVI